MSSTPVQAQAADYTRADQRLSRRLSFWQLYFIIFSGIVGSGWLFASFAASATAGPSAVISWVIAGVVALFIALTFAEVAGILPRSGAVVRYPTFTHGSYLGIIMGWCYLLWAFAVPTLEAQAVVTYASSYIPGLIVVSQGQNVLTFPEGVGMGIGLMLLFAIINYLGILIVGYLSTIITMWKLIIPTLTFILLFIFTFRSRNFIAYGGFTPFGISPIFSTIVSAGVAFATVTSLQGLEYGGEVRNPQRDLPWATILALLTAVVLYICLQLALTGSLDWSKLAINPGNWSKLEATHWAAAPFVRALQASGVGLVGAFSILLLADAFISPGATGYIYFGISLRVLFALSTLRYLPEWLQGLTRTRIPLIPLIISFVVCCLLFAPFPSWYSMVGVASSTVEVVLIMGGIGLTVLRQTAPDLHRFYRLGWASVMAPLSTMAAAIVLYWASYTVLAAVVAAAFLVLPAWSGIYAPSRGWINRWIGSALGIAFLVGWVITQRWGNWVFESPSTPLSDHPPFLAFFVVSAGEVVAFTVLCAVLSTPVARKEVWRGSWIVFFVFSTFILSYYGAYGSLPKPAIPFPWDSLIALAIGLGSYFWAVKAGFLTDEIRAVMNRGTGLITDETEEASVATASAGGGG